MNVKEWRDCQFLQDKLCTMKSAVSYFRDILCVNTGPIFYSYSHLAGLGVKDYVQ